MDSMTRKTDLFILLVVGLFLFVCLPTSSLAKTVKVLDNIYTVVRGEGVDSNRTFIITQEGVIVIDTRTTPAEAKKALAELRKITDKPVLYTINTHYHGDHTFGNQVFSEGKTIIAHENVRKLLKGQGGHDHLEMFKTFGVPGLDEVQITLPNVVYKKKMEIFLGGYHLELLHLGKGHTDGDTVVYLEALKLVIAGDLVFANSIPYVADGYIDSWIDSLQTLHGYDIEIVVPGHGEVGGKTTLIAMKHYLLKLRNHVKKQIEKGKSLEETKKIVSEALRAEYASWGHLERIESTVERAYMEYSFKK
jgi:cyclase